MHVGIVGDSLKNVAWKIFDLVQVIMEKVQQEVVESLEGRCYFLDEVVVDEDE